MATSVLTLYRRENLCKITAGAVSTIPKASQIAVGDGGVDVSGNPKEALETQTALNHELARYAISSVEYPTATTARYTAVIPKGALANAKINEAGLIDASGKLCAVKNMTTKIKDGDVSFTFKFDDIF